MQMTLFSFNDIPWYMYEHPLQASSSSILRIHTVNNCIAKWSLGACDI